MQKLGERPLILKTHTKLDNQPRALLKLPVSPPIK